MAKGKDKDKAPDNHVSGQSNKSLTRPAHALSREEVADELGADTLTGLSKDEVQKRLGEYGENDIGEAEGIQPFKIVIAQIANAMTLVGPPPPPGVRDEPASLTSMLACRCSSWPWLSALVSSRGSKAALLPP